MIWLALFVILLFAVGTLWGRHAAARLVIILFCGSLIVAAVAIAISWLAGATDSQRGLAAAAAGTLAVEIWAWRKKSRKAG